jgi:hypothetical protein
MAGVYLRHGAQAAIPNRLLGRVPVRGGRAGVCEVGGLGSLALPAAVGGARGSHWGGGDGDSSLVASARSHARAPSTLDASVSLLVW